MAISNITQLQWDLLMTLEAENTELTFACDEPRGVLSFARSDDLTAARPRTTAAASESVRTARLADFVSTFAPLFGVSAAIRTLQLLPSKPGDLGFTHLRYQQTAEADAAEKKPQSPRSNTLLDRAAGAGALEAQKCRRFLSGDRLLRAQTSGRPDRQLNSPADRQAVAGHR